MVTSRYEIKSENFQEVSVNVNEKQSEEKEINNIPYVTPKSDQE